MKSTVLSPTLIQVTRWPLLMPINVFLVREEDGFTLVDAAMRGRGPAIQRAAEAAGAPIKRIVLTHCHSDHIGALDELRKALPELEVIMSERTAEILDTNPTRTVQDGDRIGSLQVVEAPGHSPDQIALFDTRDRSLIVGDAFYTRGGTAVAGVLRLAMLAPGIFTADKAQALESAIALRGLEPSRLAVGHGNAVENPLKEMDKAIAEARRKLDGRVSNAA